MQHKIKERAHIKKVFKIFNNVLEYDIFNIGKMKEHFLYFKSRRKTVILKQVHKLKSKGGKIQYLKELPYTIFHIL